MRIAIPLLLLACSSRKQPDEPPAEPAPPGDAAVSSVADAPRKTWPGLEDYPVLDADRVIPLPAKPDVPRFDVGGPAVVGDIAVVSSSQSGFVAIDWRRGAVAWSKPADLRVAPPLATDRGFVLIGDCTNPPQIPDHEALIGCMRVVTPTGADEAYFAVRTKPAARDKFAAARGPQRVWADGEHTVRWQRGDAALSIDLLTGVAKLADPTPPPLVIQYKAQRWSITHEDGRIIARSPGLAKPAWQTEHRYTAILGPVWLPTQSPMLRIVNLGHFGDSPEVHLLDIDATGSLHGQVARGTPGIALLGYAASPIGDAAIAVRLDNSLRRDFVVGYAANAALVWVYPLPEVQRVDPVGIAIAASGEVLVFHDGDTLSVLPALSTPPTAPGSPSASSQIPTP